MSSRVFQAAVDKMMDDHHVINGHLKHEVIGVPLAEGVGAEEVDDLRLHGGTALHCTESSHFRSDAGGKASSNTCVRRSSIMIRSVVLSMLNGARVVTRS